MRKVKLQNEIQSLVILILSWRCLAVDVRDVIKVDRCYDAELETLQWDQRAEWYCGNRNLYHCVEDENGQGQQYEFCRPPVPISPGYFPTFSDDVNRIIPKMCRNGLYQPRSVDSSDINKCKEKSLCLELGQLVCSEGSITEDRKCKCDYKQGYVILAYGDSPSNKEVCCPKYDTTCKCWKKSCLDGQELNTLYQCVALCSDGFYRPDGLDDCIPIITTQSELSRPVTTEIIYKTSTRQPDKSTTIHETKFLKLHEATEITGVVEPKGTTGDNIIVTISVGLFAFIVGVLLVIWFCCPKVKKFLFRIHQEDKEIETYDELIADKKFVCICPCIGSSSSPATPVNISEAEYTDEEDGLELDPLPISSPDFGGRPVNLSISRRLSSSLIQLPSPARDLDSLTPPTEFRTRSSTFGDEKRPRYIPHTPVGVTPQSSRLHILSKSLSPQSPKSAASSVKTYKSIKRETTCCFCFGRKEIIPIQDEEKPMITLPDHVENLSPVGPTHSVPFSSGNAADSDKHTSQNSLPDIKVESPSPDDSINIDKEKLQNVAKDNKLNYKDFEEFYSEKIHRRIGIVKINENQGTGFRVGDKYVMTTFQLFKDDDGISIIDKIWRKITQVLEESSLSMEDLQGCFVVSLEDRHKYSSRSAQIDRLVKLWLHDNHPGYTFGGVTSIFMNSNPEIAKEISKSVRNLWNANIQFGLYKLKTTSSCHFSLDSNIPFYSETDNVIILKLLKNESYEIPPRFCLEKGSEVKENIYLLGHQKGRILEIDPKCQMYVGDKWRDSLKLDVDKAIEWFNNNLVVDNPNDLKLLKSQFDELLRIKKGFIAFHISKSIMHDAIGCPGVVMETSRPKLFTVQVMLQKGYPGDEFLKFADKTTENSSHKLFYEKGVAMKKVYDMLSCPKVEKLRDNIFADITEEEEKKNKPKNVTETHIHHHIHHHDHHVIKIKGSKNVAVGENPVVVVNTASDLDSQQIRPVSGSHSNNEDDSDSDVVENESGDSHDNTDDELTDGSELSFKGFKKKGPTPAKQKGAKTEASRKKEKIKLDKINSVPIDGHKTSQKLSKDMTPSHKTNGEVNHLASDGPSSVLHKTLKEQGMKIRGSTPGDGNCFFHAVVDQMKRLKMQQQNLNHLQLRGQVVWYLRNLPHDQVIDAKESVEGTWEDYLLHMERDGEYADHVIIEYTAKYLQRELIVVTSSPSSREVGRENVMMNSQDAKNGPPILLGHIYENHYESLEMEDEGDDVS